MWIANRREGAADGRAFEVLNPATEEVLDTVPRGAGADVERAVAAAARAFPEWRRTPGIERGEMLHHAARRIREDREALAILLTREGGKPLPENRDEVEWIAACLDYYAEIGRDVIGRVISPVARNQFNFVVKEPYGVCGLIVPWNYPLLLLVWKLAPALAAGNTVVAKPSEHTPLSTLRLMRAFEGFPAGVVNVVTGYGPECGMPLVEHRAVECVAFTGSQATGRQVAVACAQQLKKCHLELGGNDPFIVDAGVDLDVAARGAAWACFLNMGQVCTSAERFYVLAPVFDEFVERFVAFTRALRLGDPLGPRRRSGADDQRSAARQGRAQDRRVAGVGRAPARRRAATRALLEGLLLRAHGARGRERYGRVAARGDLRAGRAHRALPRHRRRHRARRPQRVRPGRVDLHQQPRARHEGGRAGPRRHVLDQRPADRQRRRPVRRHAQERPGRELGSEGLEDFRDSKHVHMDYVLGAKPYWYPYRYDRPAE